MLVNTLAAVKVTVGAVVTSVVAATMKNAVTLKRSALHSRTQFCDIHYHHCDGRNDHCNTSVMAIAAVVKTLTNVTMPTMPVAITWSADTAVVITSLL